MNTFYPQSANLAKACKAVLIAWPVVVMAMFFLAWITDCVKTAWQIALVFACMAVVPLFFYLITANCGAYLEKKGMRCNSISGNWFLHYEDIACLCIEEWAHSRQGNVKNMDYRVFVLCKGFDENAFRKKYVGEIVGRGHNGMGYVAISIGYSLPFLEALCSSLSHVPIYMNSVSYMRFGGEILRAMNRYKLFVARRVAKDTFCIFEECSPEQIN